MCGVSQINNLYKKLCLTKSIYHVRGRGHVLRGLDLFAGPNIQEETFFLWQGNKSTFQILYVRVAAHKCCQFCVHIFVANIHIVQQNVESIYLKKSLQICVVNIRSSIIALRYFFYCFFIAIFKLRKYKAELLVR